MVNSIILWHLATSYFATFLLFHVHSFCVSLVKVRLSMSLIKVNMKYVTESKWLLLIIEIRVVHFFKNLFEPKMPLPVY